MVIKGQHFSPTTEIKKGQHLSPDTEIKKGQHLSPKTEVKEGHHLSRNTEFKKGHRPSAGFKKGHPLFRIGPFSEDTKRKMSASLKGKHRSVATEFTSERAKQLWQDPDFVSKALRARYAKPNKIERQLIDILAKYLPEFKYNGDFSLRVTLAGMIPDFVNVNGKKEVIELFGQYWHSPMVVKGRWQGSELGRIMAYNSLGFKCLIIWQDELKQLTQEQIVDKIRVFFGRLDKLKIRKQTVPLP